MKPFLLAFALLVTAVQHPEPPKGWICANHPKTPNDHKCTCVIECTLENGQIIQKVSQTCRSWCWEKDHCACSHEGCDSHP
jgi:hypothetical protein